MSPQIEEMLNCVSKDQNLGLEVKDLRFPSFLQGTSFSPALALRYRAPALVGGSQMHQLYLQFTQFHVHKHPEQEN